MKNKHGLGNIRQRFKVAYTKKNTRKKKCVRSPGGPAEEGDEKREKFV